MALGVMAGAVKGPKAELYLQFAERMTWACFQLYNATKTGGCSVVSRAAALRPAAACHIYACRMPA